MFRLAQLQVVGVKNSLCPYRGAAVAVLLGEVIAAGIVRRRKQHVAVQVEDQADVVGQLVFCQLHDEAVGESLQPATQPNPVLQVVFLLDAASHMAAVRAPSTEQFHGISQFEGAALSPRDCLTLQCVQAGYRRSRSGVPGCDGRCSGWWDELEHSGRSWLHGNGDALHLAPLAQCVVEVLVPRAVAAAAFNAVPTASRRTAEVVHVMRSMALAAGGQRSVVRDHALHGVLRLGVDQERADSADDDGCCHGEGQGLDDIAR